MTSTLAAALDALGVLPLAPQPKPAPSGPIRVVRKGEEPDW